MAEEGNGSVRITNAQIYDLLLGVRADVASVSQTVKEKIIPDLTNHETQLAQMAPKADVAELRGRVTSLEWRVYAILSGIVGGVIALDKLGIHL